MARVAAGFIAREFRGIRGRVSVGVLLAVLSFLIYAGTLFTLPQVQYSRHCCEQSSFAAAVSNVIYRTRLGSYYSGVFDYFIKYFEDPLSQTLAKAQAPNGGLPAKPPGAWIPTTLDGNGVGYPLVATAAFRLFGLHAWALPLTMLILMAISTAAFLIRFSGAYTGIVVVNFSALTIMLFTALVWDPAYAVQIPVAGIRYFSLVSVLPVFHILLALLDRPPEQPGTGRRNAVLLTIQTVILALSILVRGSALSLIGAIAVVGLVRAWQYYRRDRARLQPLVFNFAVIGLASLTLLIGIILAVPRQYLTEGRFGTVVWQRVTESLGVHPAWPWPGVNDMFDCKKYVPQGIEAGTSDSNGGCIWFDYVTRHKIPIETLGDKSFGKLYEIALREAFFKIAARYPAEVLETFVYYKAAYIVPSITQSVRFNFEGDQAKALLPKGLRVIPYPQLAIGLLIASVAVVCVFFGFTAVATTELGAVAGVALLLTLFTMPAYLAAWAMPHTAADLLFYCIFYVGLALGAILIGVRAALRRAPTTG